MCCMPRLLVAARQETTARSGPCPGRSHGQEQMGPGVVSDGKREEGAPAGDPKPRHQPAALSPSQGERRRKGGTRGGGTRGVQGRGSVLLLWVGSAGDHEMKVWHAAGGYQERLTRRLVDSGANCTGVAPPIRPMPRRSIGPNALHQRLNRPLLPSLWLPHTRSPSTTRQRHPTLPHRQQWSTLPPHNPPQPSQPPTTCPSTNTPAHCTALNSTLYSCTAPQRLSSPTTPRPPALHNTPSPSNTVPGCSTALRDTRKLSFAIDEQWHRGTRCTWLWLS